ncbi:hypothetical protein V9R59_000762 [Vibrio harveyi]|nr:hypothetical protein [Vibrio harveyi]
MLLLPCSSLHQHASYATLKRLFKGIKDFSVAYEARLTFFLPIESPKVHSHYQPLLRPFMPKNEVSNAEIEQIIIHSGKANLSNSKRRAPATEFSIDGGDFLPPNLVSKKSTWRGAKKVVVRGVVSEAKLRWLLKIADGATELINLVEDKEVNLR